MISAQGAFNDQPVWREAVFDMHGAWPAPRGVRSAVSTARNVGFPGPTFLTPLLLAKAQICDNNILLFLDYLPQYDCSPRLERIYIRIDDRIELALGVARVGVGVQGNVKHRFSETVFLNTM